MESRTTGTLSLGSWTQVFCGWAHSRTPLSAFALGFDTVFKLLSWLRGFCQHLNMSIQIIHLRTRQIAVGSSMFPADMQWNCSVQGVHLFLAPHESSHCRVGHGSTLGLPVPVSTWTQRLTALTRSEYFSFPSILLLAVWSYRILLLLQLMECRFENWPRSGNLEEAYDFSLGQLTSVSCLSILGLFYYPY